MRTIIYRLQLTRFARGVGRCRFIIGNAVSDKRRVLWDALFFLAFQRGEEGCGGSHDWQGVAKTGEKRREKSIDGER